jgi:ParB/RepB/Spo0J family partition protein
VTPTAAELNAQFEDVDIELDLLDEPSNAERETMEEADLAELALSISEVGLIEKIVVKPKGKRFEVTAGHRRLLACRMVKYSPVPCRVERGAAVDSLALLVHENAFREDVNPVEEARFYRRVLDELCGNDVDLLCLKVRRRRDYVEDRLNLLRGDEKVINALAEKRITLGVARELNKVRDPGRLLQLLDTAINQGATAIQVMQWRKETDALGAAIDYPIMGGEHPHNPQGAPAGFSMECLFCESTEHSYMMEAFYLHKPCKDILLRMLQRVTTAAPIEDN